VRVRRVAGLLLVAALAALVPAAPAAATTSGGRPFAGAGAWVSVFAGAGVWDHPRATVAQMHRDGVHTLFLQTASTTTPAGSDVYRPDRVARFLVAAHARGMRVVAWYLPPLAHVGRELRRAMAAVDFQTASHQRFDAFALDIEPSATTPRGTLRDDNLRRLARRLRDAVGPSYQLGAIVPSPIGLSLAPRFWPAFPWPTIGRWFDVVLPMSYSSYRVSGVQPTFDYTMGNIAFLREALGPLAAIHVIGGNAGDLSAAETTAFVAACNQARVTGASLWHWGAEGPGDIQAMRGLQP
jgi:hypothetical protein